MQASVNAASDVAAGAFRAPLFSELMQVREPAQRRVVLELGQLSSGTLRLVEGSRCCLVVLDAGAELASLGREEEDAASLASRLDEVIPHRLPEPADVVLCWDLLNYLSRPLLGALGAALARIVRADARVHALVHTSNATMPAQPAFYAPIGSDEVIATAGDGPQRPAPRYTPWDLEKHGGTLKVERSVMLRNGMQEYLLRIDRDGAVPREIPALYRSR